MDNQLARIVYHKFMSVMKSTLELEEMSYREQGRNDPRYKTFKKHLMSNTYNNIRSLLTELADLGIVAPTSYEEDPKDGYKDTESGGSGYLNTAEFNKFLKSLKKDKS